MGVDELGHGLSVAENCQGFLERLQIRRTHEHRCRQAVARDDHTLMMGADALDELGEPVSDGAQAIHSSLTQLCHTSALLQGREAERG